ncbi:MAG: SDR family oxidoreductase [Caulobacteraceae bacterium]|nr:SDR family oxidoreductase [Caulobacteraceae bacterium]
MRSLKDKVVLITGGAGGIGMGMARAFGALGSHVVLADLHQGRLSARAQELTRTGVRAETTVLDVTSADAWEACVATTEEKVGPIDVLCNNAGIGTSGKVADFDISVWRRIIEVNLFGTFYGCRFVLPRMLARDEEAHIVNTASLAGMVPKGGSPYVASKHGVVGFSGDLREELRDTKVGLSVLCPAMVRTEFVANSAQVLGGGKGGNEAMAAALQSGIDPDKVGELVARSVLEGRYYVMTHPEWRPILEEHFTEILGSFGTGADPEHVENFAVLETALRRDA